MMTFRGFLAVLGSLSMTGCFAVSCTLMYVPDSVSLSFEAADTFWQDGEWTVEVDGIDCMVSLPSTENMVFCDGLRGMDSLQLQLSEDGTAIESGLLMGSTPEMLLVEIYNGDTLMFVEDLALDYEVDEPNGVGCGEVSSADVELVID